ncbi:hypothetical protein J4E91_000910 [Alternaria rosae]|nr:hypothetical protein J4E91_000910 [Alternaria rosae]
MRFSVVLSALSVLMGSFVTADLHREGLCVDEVGGQYVYNADATTKACDAYLKRNTGGQQWDTCADCKMTEVGKLNLCQSLGNHIGGDELNYYCKENGAGNSLAS